MIKTFTLENSFVKLSPLTLENFKELSSIASQEKLVQYSPSDIESADSLKNYVEIALEQQTNKTSIPFIIYDKTKQSFAGTTRYMNIDWRNKVLHIGSTWIGREFHGSGLNSNIKFLMLNHAFDVMDFEKVEFRIDERNLRSRKAVEKLGGVLEGILRKNVYLLDGFKRNTCCYGILKEEWHLTKQKNFQNY
ncbi:GNAT family N-acetyltransferase [Pseudozobellia sp. WGM2]|uniref:GNAT family N-acetyltransferase n=1 Tax=Pseudozobellia sp. WGM2 TaxID=2787625 RepID=UPI001AE045CB|nr:GNAT family protein [Pseudozobellia sp. WGM2]